MLLARKALRSSTLSSHPQRTARPLRTLCALFLATPRAAARRCSPARASKSSKVSRVPTISPRAHSSRERFPLVRQYTRLPQRSRRAAGGVRRVRQHRQLHGRRAEGGLRGHPYLRARETSWDREALRVEQSRQCLQGKTHISRVRQRHANGLFNSWETTTRNTTPSTTRGKPASRTGCAPRSPLSATTPCPGVS